MHVDVEHNPLVFTKKIFSMMGNANERIVVSALYVQDDDLGNKLLRLFSTFIEKNKSIRIDIFLDGIYKTNWIKDRYPELRNNIHIIDVNTFLPCGVFHVKGWIIDDILVFSGVNINNRYFPEKNSFRLDRYFFIHSKELCDMHICALRQIELQSQSKKWNNISLDNFNVNNADVTITPFYIFDKNQLKSELIFNLCRSAQTELFLSTPYFNISEEFKNIFIELIKRGVIIRIIVGINTQNKKNYNDRLKSNRIISSFYFDILVSFMREFENELNKSIFIYQWKNEDNSYHVKNLLIDNKTSLLTSSNFNYRSEYLDYENGFIIKAKSKKYEALLLEEKTRILDRAHCISSVEDIDMHISNKHKKILFVLKKMNLYKIIIRML